MNVTNIRHFIFVHYARDIIKKMPFTPTNNIIGKERAIHSLRWMESFARKLISYVKQVSWLTDQTSDFPFSHV